jgi:hypothetical protein
VKLSGFHIHTVNLCSSGNINFNTKALTRMTIDWATGSVGIGNTAPWAPLNIGDCSLAKHDAAGS